MAVSKAAAVPLSPMASFSSSLDGGYSTNIFSGNFDSKYLCNHCAKILRDPVQSFCGHRFCRSCIQGVVSSGAKVQCQMCLKEGVTDDYSFLQGDQMFPDNGLRREMQHLQVKCSNDGCSWKGTFKEIEYHLSNCDHRPVTCGQCGQVVPLSQTSDHESKCPKKRINCKHCKQEVFQGETEEHSKVCQKHPLKCEACGKKKIPREKMQQHLSTECQGQRIQCPAGCGWIDRNQFSQHLVSPAEPHLGWMMQELQTCRQLLSTQPTPQPSAVDMTILSAKVTDAETKLVRLEQQIFEVSARAGTTTGAASMSDATAVALQATIRTVDNRCHALEVKTGTFEGVAGTLHREIDRIITALESMERERRVAKEMIEANKRKLDTLERTIALKDMALTEQDLRLQALELSSYTGTLIWKIADFSKKQEEAARGKSISVYSPAFYTDRTGYKMCARLYPNGDGMGKGTHVSLFFVVMRGHYDALLSWPFQQRVTFMLLDQKGGQHIVDSFRPDPTSSSFKRPTSDMNIASGCPLFLPLARLQETNTAYVKDDTMFIRIIVDTTENSRPVINFPAEKK